MIAILHQLRIPAFNWNEIESSDSRVYVKISLRLGRYIWQLLCKTIMFAVVKISIVSCRITMIYHFAFVIEIQYLLDNRKRSRTSQKSLEHTESGKYTE
jgi:hypothetical protein